MRNSIFLFGLLAYWLAGVAPARADRAIFPEKELIGRADIIAVATVQTAGAISISGRQPQVMLGLRLDDTLKGDAKIKQVSARCGLVSVKGEEAFTAGQQRLFFLQRGQDAYTVLNALDSVLPATEAGRIKELIALNPLVVTMAVEAPVLVLEQLQQIPVKVTNRGKERIEVYGYMEGFYEKAAAGTLLAFDQEVIQQSLRIRLTLEPGEEKILQLICRAKQYPPATDENMEIPALLRAVVRLSDYHNGFHMATAWIPGIVKTPGE